METELDFEKHYRLVREVIETVVLTVLMFLIIRLAVQNFNVDGFSMEPNLHNTELIIVDKWTYRFHPLTRGDVIVFVAPPHPSQDYVKRVIGLPGDVLSIQGTTVIVNGKTLNEPYVKPQNQGNINPSFTNKVIPPGEYFVMGDNRAGSSDSREWGCVPQQNIIGRAAIVYWPIGKDNYGLLRNVAASFTNIPTPSKIRGPSDTCTISKSLDNNNVGTSTPLSQNTLNMSVFLLLAMPGTFVAMRRKPLQKHS